MVDVAAGLEQLGHSVEILTSHHDPSHSFEETNDGAHIDETSLSKVERFSGTLQIKLIPTFLPRSIRGGLHIYLAIVRQFHLMMVLIFRLYTGFEPWHDVYVVDQLSACVPLLRFLTGRRVVFYCHFPDKLLAGGKEANLDNRPQLSLGKQLYRGPVDWVEGTTTGQFLPTINSCQPLTSHQARQTFY